MPKLCRKFLITHDISPKSYAVEEIVGERGRSRATKHFLVKYEGYEDAWWQPAKNLCCTAKVQQCQWAALSPEAKIEKTAQASMANPHDINLIMDLSLGKQKRMATLILDVCEKICIDRKRFKSSAGITHVQHLHKIRSCE